MNIKSEEAYYQCSLCGAIHFTYKNKVIDYKNDVYFGTWCPECHDTTKHLWIGVDELDKYMYYDNSLDERFFIYKKTK